MRFCNMTLMHHYEKDDFVHYAMLKRGNKHSTTEYYAYSGPSPLNSKSVTKLAPKTQKSRRIMPRFL